MNFFADSLADTVASVVSPSTPPCAHYSLGSAVLPSSAIKANTQLCEICQRQRRPAEVFSETLPRKWPVRVYHAKEKVSRALDLYR